MESIIFTFSPQELQPAPTESDEGRPPLSTVQVLSSFVHRGIKKNKIKNKLFSRLCGQTDRFFIRSRGGGGSSSCGERGHFYLERGKAVANLAPVLQVIFFCIVTAHRGVGSAEVGLKRGDRMWCPGSDMEQEVKNSEHDSCVLATRAFSSRF